MIVARSQPAFAAAPQDASHPPVGIVSDSSLLQKAKDAADAFKARVAALLESPAQVMAARSKLLKARADVDANVTGGPRATTLADLDRMLADNASLQNKVDAASETVAAGQAKLAELAIALGTSGFGIAPIAIAAIIAALAALTFAIGKIVDAVAVHRQEVENEARKVDLVLSGQLPPESLQSSTPPPGAGGGGGLGGIAGDVRSLVPIAALALLLPLFLGHSR